LNDELSLFLFDANQLSVENLPTLITSNLHINEQVICNQRIKETAKKEFVASRTIIKQIISTHNHLEYNLLELRFNHQTSKLEAFTNKELLPYNLSIAHSNGILFIAISSQKFKVGVDIEKLNDKRDYKALAKNFYHPIESEQVQINGVSEFYRFWTLKEAFSKMLPQAMTITLNQSIQNNLANYSSNSGVYLDFDLSTVTEKSFNEATVSLLSFDLFFKGKHVKNEY